MSFKLRPIPKPSKRWLIVQRGLGVAMYAPELDAEAPHWVCINGCGVFAMRLLPGAPGIRWALIEPLPITDDGRLAL